MEDYVKAGSKLIDILPEDGNDFFFVVLNYAGIGIQLFYIEKDKAFGYNNIWPPFDGEYRHFFNNKCFYTKGLYYYRYTDKKLVDSGFIKNDNITVNGATEVGYVALNKLYGINPMEEEAVETLQKNLKVENLFNSENDDIGKTDIYYEGINVTINSNYEECKKHISDDNKVLEDVGLDKILRENFLPWFKIDEIKDLDDDKILDGLKVVEVRYNYQRIVENYSPTKETDYFGVFEFTLESSSDYTKDLLQSVVMNVYINNGKFVGIKCYDN